MKSCGGWVELIEMKSLPHFGKVRLRRSFLYLVDIRQTWESMTSVSMLRVGVGSWSPGVVLSPCSGPASYASTLAFHYDEVTGVSRS